MLSLNRNGYTKQQVMDVLHSKITSRQLSYRYDLLDKNEVFKKTLDSVINGSISMDAEAKIKRTASFYLKDDGSINWLSDRIKPYGLVKMSDGGMVEFPLGIFLLSSPARNDVNEVVYRDVKAYDGLVVLVDDKLESRMVIMKDSSYIQVIKAILNDAGITKINIENTSAILPTDLEFESGTEKLDVINELLKQINYNPLYVDVEGFYTSRPYRDPSIRGADYVYKDDELSVTYSGLIEELDLFNVPNKWISVVSNGDAEPMISTYTNENPNSITSTVNRGRVVMANPIQVKDIADQETLDAYTRRIAYESSQIYGSITFETAIMPMHDYLDVLELHYSPLGINGKYQEVSWSFPLETGGKMQHTLQKVVSV